MNNDHIDKLSEEVDEEMEKDVSICPLLFTKRYDNTCMGLRCAWYDDKNNQCILITLGRKEWYQ